MRPVRRRKSHVVTCRALRVADILGYQGILAPSAAAPLLHGNIKFHVLYFLFNLTLEFINMFFISLIFQAIRLGYRVLTYPNGDGLRLHVRDVALNFRYEFELNDHLPIESTLGGRWFYLQTDRDYATCLIAHELHTDIIMRVVAESDAVIKGLAQASAMIGITTAVVPTEPPV